MLDALKQLLKSKKALLTLVSILVFIGGKFHLDLDAEVLYPVVGSLAMLVLSIGFQDFGKEAAAIEVDAPDEDLDEE